VQALGLEIDGVPVPDLVEGPPPPGRVRVRVVAEERPEPLPETVRLEHAEGEGWTVAARGHGRHAVTEAGGDVILDAEPTSASGGVRLLFAQTLPLAATLQGIEVLHASAVALPGGVTALVAPSGGGKSTVAATLLRAGAAFVTDDALAITLGADDVVAHPGPRRLRLPEAADLDGDVVAHEDKLVLAPARVAAPAPLRRVVVLDRAAGHARLRLVGERERAVPLLLAATFVPYVRRPARLTRLLEVATEVAARVDVLRLEVPARAAPGDVARLLTDG